MKVRFIVSLFLVLTAPIAWGDVWKDEFDGETLNEAWNTITDRPEQQGFVKVEDGKLLVNEPLGNFGHTVTDGRPLVLRDAPDGEFSISALVDTIPEAPAKDYWVGLFIIGSAKDNAAMAKNWSALCIGGSAGEVKALIGSMIDNNWNDKGHFDIPEWPIYLRLTKKGTELNGYYREKETDDWTQIGGAWNDNMEAPEKVGLGFINNWGGTNLTLVAEFFALEGPNVKPMSVSSDDKTAIVWAELKR